MQRYAERRHPELSVQTEFLESEKVFVEIFCKVSTDELFTTIVECIRAIRTSITECRTLSWG
jgi:hypothetical protein